MANLEQVPFGGVEFADNPEPRCACVLLLDVSGSMAGPKIAQLNEGLKTFAEELRSDSMAAKRVEIATVTFGPVAISQPFVTADSFAPTMLTPQGDTPMGAAITQAIAITNERKNTYRTNGIGYYRPWIFMITDGAPTDDTEAAASAVRQGEASRAFAFYAVGVEGADLPRLKQIAVRDPLVLRGLSFREMFVWLSNSLGTRARSQPHEEIPLNDPTGPKGWATAAT